MAGVSLLPLRPVAIAILLGVPILGGCRENGERARTEPPPAQGDTAASVPAGGDTTDSAHQGGRSDTMAWAQRDQSSCPANLPRFEDYPADTSFRGPPAPVDLASSPDARQWRTRLIEGARQGPNFAGHFTVVEWGCGSPCQVQTIIDARTGRIFHGVTTALGARYRLNSRLFVANPPDSTGCFDPQCGYCRPMYLLWTGGRLDSIW